MWLGEEDIHLNVSYKEWQSDILNNPNRMRKKKPNVLCDSTESPNYQIGRSVKRWPSSSCVTDWHHPAETESLNHILHPASWLSLDSFANLVWSFCRGERRYALRDRHQESSFTSSFHDARLPFMGLLQALHFLLICSVIKSKAFKHHPTSNWKRITWFEKNFTLLLVKKRKFVPVLGPAAPCHAHRPTHPSWTKSFPLKEARPQGENELSVVSVQWPVSFLEIQRIKCSHVTAFPQRIIELRSWCHSYFKIRLPKRCMQKRPNDYLQQFQEENTNAEVLGWTLLNQLCIGWIEAFANGTQTIPSSGLSDFASSILK